MSVKEVKQYFEGLGLKGRVMEFDVSSATVELAAGALGTEPARIAKTLSFKDGDGCLLLLCTGDARVDNKKFKERFGFKAKMLAHDEVPELVGHPVGGVCPFVIKEGIPVFLDESLLRFKTVFPAAGSANSAIELTPDELFKFSKAEDWVDVCSRPGAQPQA